jgi:class 3 adenylate cyclase/pimeloyl-ACP methyl ester carboxylesterase
VIDQPLRPKTKYTDSGAVTIAYQVVGNAALDLLYIPGWFFNPEVWGNFVPIRRYLERLATFARVISVEKRGFGMSDRLSSTNLPTVQERVADIGAVAEAERLGPVAVMGPFEGGTLGLLWAAAEPERVSAIVVINSFAQLDWERSIFGTLSKRPEDLALAARALWELFESGWSRWFRPDFPLTAAQEKQLSRAVRLSANPTVIRSWLTLVTALDARAHLTDITAPVLIIHQAGDAVVDVSHGRFLADHLPNATYVEIPGRDHVPWGSNFELIMAEVEGFLTGQRPTRSIQASTRTIMFTDIVASTQQLAALGDRTWTELLQRHDEISIDVLERFGGRCVKSTGDGLLAELPGPVTAVECARLLVAELHSIGVDLRVGLHTGPCELYGDDVIGLAVNVAARIMAEAQPGEILVSQTLRDLMTEPTLMFSARGERDLKGVPGRWALFAVT